MSLARYAVSPQPSSGAAGPLLQGLPAVISSDTRLLILGSFPGTASLQAGQYYAHPRNQFWPLLADLWGLPELPKLPYAARLAVCAAEGLGLWDVYAACRREGSLDSAIREARFNDLPSLRERAPRLAAIAHNGGESARGLRFTAALGLPVLRLPSSSPANASWSFVRKREAWAEAWRLAGLRLAAESPPKG